MHEPTRSETETQQEQARQRRLQNALLDFYSKKKGRRDKYRRYGYQRPRRRRPGSEPIAPLVAQESQADRDRRQRLRPEQPERPLHISEVLDLCLANLFRRIAEGKP
jgi:hypothetical protein